MTRPVFSIRTMEWDDLPRLAGMGKDDPHPWDYADLVGAMESPYALGLVVVGRRPDRGDTVVGYAIYIVSDVTGKTARKQSRLHLTVGLLHLSIDGGRTPAGSWRRRGAARFLVDSIERGLIDQFSAQAPQGRIRITATLPESWLDAQLFFKGIGFAVPRDGGISPSPFDHCGDDGYLFERRRDWPKPRPGKTAVGDVTADPEARASPAPPE